MISTTRKILLVATIMALVALAGAGGAQAEPPVKLLVESQAGAKVNLDESNFCLESECKPAGAEASTIPGGFGESSPTSVAVGPNGNLYVADEGNQRVQEITPTGEFVLMFGSDVNETKGGDICTETEIVASGVKCKAGVSSAISGGFRQPASVAVDPVSGNVYVEDFSNWRVQEFTATGAFVLMIGQEVNESKDNAIKAKGGTPTQAELEEENLCTAASGNVCKAGAQAAVGSTEHGAFDLPEGSDNDLAVGGSNDLLYVGDEHRVQEFKPDGTWVRDLALTQISSLEAGKVRAIAVDQTSGDVYLVYNGAFTPQQLLSTIFEFDATGQQVGEVVLKPRGVGVQLTVEAIALDSSGRLATVERETTIGTATTRWFGSLLHAVTGKPVSGFTVLPSNEQSGNMPSIAFNASTVGMGEKMYGAAPQRDEIVGYIPKEVAELTTGAVTCKEESEQETSVTLACTLNGQVDPENVANTETWFLWSSIEETLGGSETHRTIGHPISPGSALEPAPPAIIGGLRPDEAIHYELAGDDEFVPESEYLTGEELSVVTPVVPARILGEPGVSFVKSSSAVMFGELNPENAATEYFFEYGSPKALEECPNGVRAESCAGIERTRLLESQAYTKIDATLEATGLQPATEYAYRLSAENENKSKGEKHTSVGIGSQVRRFQTAQAPRPQATTGQASGVGTSSATVSGTVNADGQPAVYTFELGVYNGGSTQYGVVFSGPVGAGIVPVEVTLTLSGLQAGTTYAYRVAVASGYGNVHGETGTFTTAGLPSVLVVPSVPAQLPIPAIRFPAEAKIATVRALTPAQMLAKALKACEMRPKSKRATCRRSARKKYEVTKKTKSKRK